MPVVPSAPAEAMYPEGPKQELGNASMGGQATPALDKLLGAAPPAARAFASSMMGDRSKIDESFFRTHEIDALREISETALSKGKKVIGYGEYGKGGTEETAFQGFKSGTKQVKEALTDLRSSLSFTLGMAKVRKEADGTIVISDKYDFAASKKQVADLKAQGTWGILKMGMKGLAENGLLGPLNVVGNLAMPAGGGRDVEIRIPPRKQ